MLKLIKSFFKKTPEPVAPYKVETPAPVVEVVPAPVTIAVEGAGVVEIPAKPAKKTAAKKTPAVKKPRAPKATKAK